MKQEHIFTTKSYKKKGLLKLLDTNIKKQQCGVNKVWFLLE